VDDELVKVVRSQNPTHSDGADFAVETLSAVRFAPLLPHPAIETVIPARVWSPSEHHFYPDTFRMACKELLLCSSAKTNQEPVTTRPQTAINAASLLPKALWVEVLSYTHRDCKYDIILFFFAIFIDRLHCLCRDYFPFPNLSGFQTPESEIETLRKRLLEEKAKTAKAELARIEAERKCQLAEKERDVYRLLARRWKSRLIASSGEGDGEAETIEEAAAAMLLGSRESGSLFGIGNMFRRFRYRSSAPDSDGTENEEEATEPTDRMEEDDSEDDDDDEMDDDSEEGEEAGNVDESVAMADDGNDSMVDVAASKAKVRSSQATARTVSISEEDFDDDF
jgi:hypothetical protein